MSLGTRSRVSTELTLKTRPSKRINRDFPPLAEYRLRANPAHDMLRVVEWTAAAKEGDFNQVYSAHVRPLIAVVFACAGIEGYVNYVGHTLDAHWPQFSKGMLPGQKGRPGIKDKVKRLYAKLSKTPATGVLNRVYGLFEKRGYLMHPTVEERTHIGDAPPADVLEMIGEDYAPVKVAKIAREFKKMLLDDSAVRDLSWSLAWAQKFKEE